jgi:hypothetical protein
VQTTTASVIICVSAICGGGSRHRFRRAHQHALQMSARLFGLGSGKLENSCAALVPGEVQTEAASDAEPVTKFT